MPAKTARWVFPLCVTVGVLMQVVPTRADDVVAELSRDTPIAAYGEAVAWSDFDAATARYRLVIRQGGKASPARIAGARLPFDVSLGPDVRGRVVALYTRCRTTSHGCDVFRYDIRARSEHKVGSVSSSSKDEAWPAQWGDRLAFVRRERVYGKQVNGSYDVRPDPRGKRGGGTRVECDIPYVKTLSVRAPSRPLDRGFCAPTTGMSIRGKRIVQVTDVDQGGAGSETQVRVLAAGGGAGRVLARQAGGEGGYSPFSSPSQSASAIYLTRTGFREATLTGFVRIDLASGRLTTVLPNMPLAGRVVRDERGAFWYVRAPESPEEDHGEPPFCVSPLEPCRLVRASASPFSSATRALPARLRASVKKRTDTNTPSIIVSGDYTRAVVRRSAVVRREPLAGVTVELLRSDRPEARGPFARTGLSATTDGAGRWSFTLRQPPSMIYVAALARGAGVASGPLFVCGSGEPACADY